MTQGHLLAAASRIWADVGKELESGSETDLADAADGVIVSPEEVKKVAKWMQHVLTKFGASAAVADGPEDKALKPIAEELIKVFTVAIGTLLSLKRGACPSLVAELRSVGGGLAEAMDALGAAIGTPEMALNSGKVLDRNRQFERVSTQNRAAIRRRVLGAYKQIQDASRELNEALQEKPEDEAELDDDDFDDDFGCFDESLEPEERALVEAIAKVAADVSDVLKATSQACVPKEGSEGRAASVAELEAARVACEAAVNAVDGLAAHSLGGVDPPALALVLKECIAASQGLLVTEDAAWAGAAASLAKALGDVQTALDVVISTDDA